MPDICLRRSNFETGQEKAQVAEQMDQPTQIADTSKVEMAAEIVSAYVSHNTIGVTEIPALIASVHEALAALGAGSEAAAPAQDPAVPVRTSVKPDSIACLDCGKKFKSLKRHLRTSHDLTPEEYRAKWDLKPDYPMVAPQYAAARSTLAKQIGLGQKR
jgi:predicted transcriptional regulator